MTAPDMPFKWQALVGVAPNYFMSYVPVLNTYICIDDVFDHSMHVTPINTHCYKMSSLCN